MEVWAVEAYGARYTLRDADGEVGRRRPADQGVRSHRAWRRHLRGRLSGKLSTCCQEMRCSGLNVDLHNSSRRSRRTAEAGRVNVNGGERRTRAPETSCSRAVERDGEPEMTLGGRHVGKRRRREQGNHESFQPQVPAQVFTRSRFRSRARKRFCLSYGEIKNRRPQLPDLQAEPTPVLRAQLRPIKDYEVLVRQVQAA